MRQTSVVKHMQLYCFGQLFITLMAFKEYNKSKQANGSANLMRQNLFKEDKCFNLCVI